MYKVSLKNRWLVLTSLFVMLAGCATVPKDSADWPPPRDNMASLQPGDVLLIKFPYWSDLNEEQTIRPDGRIALQHIGDVDAAGRGPEELRQELIKRYAGVLKNPELSVTVQSYASHKVYVGGEVATPGMVLMENTPLTVVDAIIRSGGFLKQSAKLRTVIVIRQRDGKQYARSLDLRKAFNGTDHVPFYLEPYDIVYVPRTNIDRVNQWVDQYINGLAPDNVVFTFNKDLDNKVTTESRSFQVNLPTVQP